MNHYAHAYLAGAFFPLPIWLILYYLRPDLRKEMVLIGSISGLLAIIFAPAVLNDYWHPSYAFNRFGGHWPFGGIEDFVYTFFIMGIASVLYEEIFGKKYARRRNRRARFHEFVVPALIFYILSFYVPVWLGMPSIYAAILSSGLLLAIVLAFRCDLLTDALLSGLIMGILVFAGYIVFLRIYPNLFKLDFYPTVGSNGYILKVPINEILWAFALGAVAGPVYEFFEGLKIQRRKT